MSVRDRHTMSDFTVSGPTIGRISNIMNAIKWTGEYAMQDFVIEFSHNIPVLMKTLTGTLGCDEIHVISGDEIYWIRGIEKQKRIVASVKYHDKFLSIPVSYPIKFEFYVNPKSRASKINPQVESLSQIVEEMNLSSGNKYFIRAVNNEKLSFQIGCDAGNKARFGMMEVVDTYDEKYLVGHSICDNQIHSNTFGIPVYMNIELSAATSLLKYPQECFVAWFKLIEDIVRTFPNEKFKMCEEIIIFNECPNQGTYEYIDPKMFTMSEEAKSKFDGFSKQSNTYIREPPPAVPDRRHEGNKQPSKSTPVIKSVNLPSIPRRAAPNPPTATQTNEKSPKHNPSSSHNLKPKDCLSINIKQTPNGSKSPAFRQDLPVEAGTNSDISEECYYDGVSPAKVQNNVPLIKIKEITLDKSVKNLYNQMTLSSRASALIKPDSGDITKILSPDEKGGVPQTETPSSILHIYEVKPEADVSKFSIRDVVRCLKILNLEKHCETFEKMQVDGELLMCVDVDILINDFQMTRFEALKLIKFAQQGWRPTL